MIPRLLQSLRPGLLIAGLLLGLSTAHAQALDDEDKDVDQIEAEIGKGAKKENPVQTPEEKGAKPTPEPQTLSDLSRLAPFTDVSVLQKRYMPKTERFQFFMGLGAIMNDPWFNGLGGSLALDYHFTEEWGIEGVGTFLSTSAKDSVNDLHNNENVDTDSLVSTKGYYGLNVFWAPIYGKMSLFNKRIIPFDMYFTAGGGESSITGSSSSAAPTIHLGLGQIYALSKAWGFRWDVTYNTFSATSQQTQNTQQYNNVILTLGYSFFFPEAKYR